MGTRLTRIVYRKRLEWVKKGLIVSLAQLTKLLEETLTLTDTLWYRIIGQASDGVGFIDSVTGFMKRILFEDLNLIDAFTGKFSTAKDDALSLVDSLYRKLIGVSADGVSFTDSVIGFLASVKTETLSLGDSMIGKFRGALADGLTLVDSMVGALIGMFSDGFSFADSVLGALHLSFSDWTDNFNDNTKDPRWDELEDDATVNEVNQRLEVTALANTTQGISGYVSHDKGPMNGRHVEIDVVNFDRLEEMWLHLGLTKVTSEDPHYEDDWYHCGRVNYRGNGTTTFYVQRRVGGAAHSTLFTCPTTETGILGIMVRDGNIYFFDAGTLVYSEAYALGSYECYIYIYQSTLRSRNFGTDVFDNFRFLSDALIFGDSIDWKLICQQACELACQTACLASCQEECVAECKSCAETGGCEETCEISCQTSCELECKTCTELGLCMEGCEISCETTCELECEDCGEVGPCETQCEGECQEACETEPCQTSCELGCQTSCEIYCKTTCELECQSHCEESCQEACMLECQPGDII